MKIKKVLNNNAVTVIDENKQEIVVMGLGLAFQKKAGDEHVNLSTQHDGK